MELDAVKDRIKELDDKLGWYQNIDLKNGLQTKTRTVWGEAIDHPRQRWESVAPGFPSDFTGKSVLDIGCNAGFFSFVAADRGCRDIVAIDYSSGYIEQARFCNDVRGDLIDFRVGYANDLVSIGRSFDITLCIGLLYHVPDIMGAIQQIGEVTNEMVIVESAIYLDHNELPLVRVADGKGRVPGTWHPNMTALEFMFRKVGFKSTKPLFKRGGRGGILAYK